MPVHKTMSSKLEKLGSLCNQAVTESKDRLQNSLSQFTEIKIYRGTQREYSSKPHKHSIVKCTLVFKR